MTPTERPILFSGPMVLALLDERKTQTRRMIKPQPPSSREVTCEMDGRVVHWFRSGEHATDICQFCPYGQSGDRLWVKETFLYRAQKTAAIYRADVAEPEASGLAGMYGGWKPSIHMPRRLSRLTLEIVAVRVERVQDIGKDGRKANDVRAEGISDSDIEHWRKWLHPDDAPAHTYGVLWDSINGKGSWEKNPWVWVVEFRKCPTP